MDAFAATLEETALADLVLHVVDASEPEESLVEMTRAVEDVLEEIHAADSPRVLVLNKADAIDDERRAELAFRHPDAVLVSAVTGEGLEDLRERIAAEFERTLTDVALLVPYSEGGTLSDLHDVAGASSPAPTPPRACSSPRACPPCSRSATTATRSTATAATPSAGGAEPGLAAAVVARRQLVDGRAPRG